MNIKEEYKIILFISFVIIFIIFTPVCSQSGKAWIEPNGVNVTGVEKGAVQGEVGVVASHNKTQIEGSTITTNSGSGWLVFGGTAFLLIYTALIGYLFRFILKRNKLMLDVVCQSVCDKGHEDEIYDNVKKRINGGLLRHIRRKLRQPEIFDNS